MVCRDGLRVNHPVEMQLSCCLGSCLPAAEVGRNREIHVLDGAA